MKSTMRKWFLSLSLAGLASGATTLVCDEKAGSDENRVSCQFDVGYDDIAAAFNLNCEPSENGLKCQFEANTNTKTTVFAVTPQVKACSENDEVCLNSRIQTQLIPSPRPPEKTQTTTPDAPQKQQQQQQEKAAGNEAEEAILVEQPPTGIRVGNYVYKEPFRQYATPIEKTLKNRASLFKSEPRDIATEYALANAHLDLGISHFTAVTEEDYSPGIHSTENSAPESFDLKLAVNAFRQAERMYKNILHKYDREKETIYKSFGSLYLQWGEVYQNSHYFDDEIEEDEGTEFNKLALKQYQQSEKYYRLALESGREEESLSTEYDLKDIQINLAHVSHRIGRCLINSVAGAAVMAEDINLDQTDLSDAIPQLQTLMHTVPKAEEKFAEAIRLYRIAIEEEMDFDAQNRLKMNLATSLQDGGTAASYASNLPKSIEYQEEGIGVSKEILPHVGTADRNYLVQYIADSMYGLANHYMQLGKYEETKSTYKAAMDWYEQHHLDPAVTAPGFEVTDESLEAYEKQLEDYHELIREVTMPDGYQDDGQPMYGPNHAYEADLHAALGSLHLSREEVLMAIDHFNQAIRLYQKDESDENLDRSIADVKVSLAAAYFKDGEFAKSAEAHNDAMDVYKVEVGEGKNPILAGLAEKLSGTIDLNDVVAGSEISELLGAADIQELLAGMGVDTEDLTAKLEQLTKGKTNKATEQVEEKQRDTNTKKPKEVQKEGQKVHEELINADIIEKVRQSILNATSMKGEL